MELPAVESLNFLLFLPLEEPMYPIFVGEMPIAAKGQIPQIVQERLVCSCGKFVEDGSQLTVLSTVDIHADHIALSRCSRCMHPVCGCKLDGTAFQVGVDNLVLVLWRYLVFHGSVAGFRQG